ncbi:MAG: hypothetical protein E7773_13855 [Sphingomonas sp.]|uniref:hypothetical protein n=1 Tax=Sphingomonas sp. TaxID=28214 RepID=UPI00120B6BF9|nr:hypothetical protein [Sphingomonas sp.]THD34745.1 MAG: hypothetical protein E7773_13855 [Sphingomonas sp.]
MVNMGNVWDRTTEFLSDNARALLPIALFAMLIPHAINALVGRAGNTVHPLAASLIGLACVLAALWGQIAVVALALDPAGGRARAVGAATASYGRALLAMLFVLVVLCVLALPILGVFAASGADLSALRNGGMAHADLSGAATTFVVIYFLALIVLAIVATIRLVLLYPVIVAEGGVIRAIQRSAALTGGIFWKTLGVWLLFTVVYLVASMAVTSALGVVVGLFSPLARPFSAGSIIVAILSGIVTTVFTLVVAAFSAKLYQAARGAREGAAAAA